MSTTGQMSDRGYLAAMSFPRWFHSGLLLLVGCGCVLSASAQPTNQFTGPLARVPFLAAAMSELFSDSRAFSAQAIVQLPGDQAGQGIPLGFATLNGQMRWFLDLSQARSGRLDGDMTSLLREAKLGQFILLLRPNTNAIVAVPGTKQWFALDPPKPAGLVDQAQEKVGFLQKTEVGREVIDGHPCVKYRLDLPKERSVGEVAYVWQATDLRNLPVKFEAQMNGETYGLSFRLIKDAAPDARHFDPPTGFTRVSGPEVLLQQALLGSLTGGGLGSP